MWWFRLQTSQKTSGQDDGKGQDPPNFRKPQKQAEPWLWWRERGQVFHSQTKETEESPQQGAPLQDKTSLARCASAALSWRTVLSYFAWDVLTVLVLSQQL